MLKTLRPDLQHSLIEHRICSIEDDIYEDLYRLGLIHTDAGEILGNIVITSYSIHYTKLYDLLRFQEGQRLLEPLLVELKKQNADASARATRRKTRAASEANPP